MTYTLGRTPVFDLKYTVGIAYVALPTDVKREDYIRDCYRNFTVSVWGEDGSFMNRLPVAPELMNHLEFPAEASQLGSPVVYVTEQSQSLPIVIARFPLASEVGDAQEWDYKISRSYDDAHMDFFGSPKTGSMMLSVDAGKKAGAMMLKVNGEQDGQLSLAAKGSISCQATESTAFEQQQAFRTTTTDRSAPEGDDSNDARFEQYPGEHHFKNKRFIINKGEEPMVLGKKLKGFLSDLIDEISKATVTTAIGQQPLLNAAQIAAFKKRTDEFVSIVGFINE